MSEEKRVFCDYTVEQSIFVGNKEVLLGVDKKNTQESIITITKQTCGSCVSVLMNFVVSMPCPSLRSRAAGRSPMPFTKPRRTVCQPEIPWHGRRWMKLSQNRSR